MLNILIVILISIIIYRFYYHKKETFRTKWNDSVMDPFRKMYADVEKLNKIIGDSAMSKKNIRRFPNEPNEIKREEGKKMIEGLMEGVKVLFAKQITKDNIFVFKIYKNKKIDHVWFKYKNEEAADIAQLIQKNNIYITNDKDCKTCLDYTYLGPSYGVGKGCDDMKSGIKKCKWNKKQGLCETRLL